MEINKRHKDLKENAKRCGWLISQSKNEKTEREYDEVVDELVTFEKEYNLNK